MMSVQNVPMRITSLRKEAKRDPAAFAPKMHQRAGLGANFRGSCNCIILDMATDITVTGLIQRTWERVA